MKNKSKVLFVIKYQCNFSVSCLLASINTNFYFITFSILTDYDMSRKNN